MIISSATDPSSTLVTRVARGVTDVFAPAILVAAISIAVALHSGSLLWGTITAVFASAIPASHILRKVRRGEVSDRHVRVRAQRSRVLMFAAGSVAVGLALMIIFKAPRELIALVVAMLGGLALAASVTHWITKVSMHTAIASGTAMILCLVFGPWLLLSWAVVALIGWSRLQLHEHTRGQVALGLLLGAAAAGLIFPPLR